MANSDPKKKESVPPKTKLVPEQDDERLQDEEKILEGRHDVNYPALLTKDVPGG